MAMAKASAADPFVQQSFRVLLGSDLGTLEALLVRPSEPGRYPLVLLAHGSPRSGADRPAMTPMAMLPEALEFASRGWAAAIVMRRGYGNSDGGWAESFGSCDNPNYVAAGEAGAADLKTTLEFLSHRPDIDPTRLMAVGVSAGGFATVALTADPPQGLVAAISFAGGRGSLEADKDCRPDKLIEAFRAFGRRSRVPMLWVYAANDHFFGPALAQQLSDAFKSAGGNLDFVTASSFGNDGHSLFSVAGIPVWTGYVDTFLKKQNLALRSDRINIPHPVLTPPAALSASGRRALDTYLMSGPHKAFAMSADGGAFGWRTGMRTTDAARAVALKACEQNGAHCDVVFIDDASAR
jgi:dienelactone hydrolase